MPVVPNSRSRQIHTISYNEPVATPEHRALLDRHDNDHYLHIGRHITYIRPEFEDAFLEGVLTTMFGAVYLASLTPAGEGDPFGFTCLPSEDGRVLLMPHIDRLFLPETDDVALAVDLYHQQLIDRTNETLQKVRSDCRLAALVLPPLVSIS